MSNNGDFNIPKSASRNRKSDETPQSKILIIDDSEDDILLTKSVLAKIRSTLNVEIARDGKEGLALIRFGTERPALILLDLKMPCMDGFDVLREIRKDAGLSSTPVIVISHSDLESDRADSFKYGANGFLNKSVNLDQFKKDVEAALECWCGPNAAPR